jgi:hypothetical protein
VSYYKPQAGLPNCEPSSFHVTLTDRRSINCIIFGRRAGQQREGHQLCFPRGNVLLSVTTLLRSEDDLLAAQRSPVYALSSTTTVWSQYH